MLTRVGLAVAACLLFTQTALAQGIEPPPPPPPPPPPSTGVAPAVAPLAPGAYGSKGTMEADGALALGYPTWSGADFDMLFIPGFHYFIMDRLSVGATMRIGFVTGGGGFTVFQFVPGAQYHFNPTASNLIPYLGAGLGFDYWSAGGGSDTAFLLDLEGGVKFNLAPRMFAGAGIDIPIAFHSKTGAYLNVLGRYIYTF